MLTAIVEALRSAGATEEMTIPVSLPLVAIERASGSVSETCLSSLCI
jgi:hypothetical protein